MPKVGGKRRKTKTHKEEEDEEDIIGKIPKSNYFTKHLLLKEEKLISRGQKH